CLDLLEDVGWPVGGHVNSLDITHLMDIYSEDFGNFPRDAERRLVTILVGNFPNGEHGLNWFWRRLFVPITITPKTSPVFLHPLAMRVRTAHEMKIPAPVTVQ